MGYAIYPVALTELAPHHDDAARWSICVTELDGDETGWVEVFVAGPHEIDGKPLDAWIVDRIEALHPPSDDYLARLQAAQPIDLTPDE